MWKGKGMLVTLALIALPLGWVVGAMAFGVSVIPAWVELEGWAPNIVASAAHNASGFGVALLLAAPWWLAWRKRSGDLKLAGDAGMVTRAGLPIAFAAAALLGFLNALAAHNAF